MDGTRPRRRRLTVRDVQIHNQLWKYPWTESKIPASYPCWHIGTPSGRDDAVRRGRISTHLFLVDVRGEPPVFRYRLVGTEIVRRYGRDDTSETLDAISDATMRETVRSQYLAAIEKCGPICHHNRFVFADYRILEYRRLLLALSPDAENINILLGGVHYISVKGDPPAAK